MPGPVAKAEGHFDACVKFFPIVLGVFMRRRQGLAGGRKSDSVVKLIISGWVASANERLAYHAPFPPC